MMNDILDELWSGKEQIAAEHSFEIADLVAELKEKQEKHGGGSVDLSKKANRTSSR